MNKSLLLLHGFKSTSDSYFLPQLKKRFENTSDVHAPDMPSPHEPHVDAWTEAVLSHGNHFDAIVCHSLGGTLAMSMLTRKLLSCDMLMTIGSSPGPKENDAMNTFLKYPLNFDAIKEQAANIIAVQSYDDPWTHWEYGQLIVKHANATGMFFADKGHFESKHLPDEVLLVVDKYIK